MGAGQPHISGLVINECSFPNITIDGIDFEEVSINRCDFEILRFLSTNFSNCTLRSIECKQFRLGNFVYFQNSIIELDEGEVIIDDDTKIELHNCRVSSNVLKTLEDAQLTGANIVINNVTPIPPQPLVTIEFTKGRRFLNKLMAFARRSGRKQFSIYEYKLRDCTPGSDEQFRMCIDLLEKAGCIERRLSWIVITPLATEHMYSYRPNEEPKYDSHKDFWEPILAELDELLGK